MNTLELEQRIKRVVTVACRVRGDSEEHRKACIADVLREPKGDWPWWIAYFEGQAEKAQGKAA